jgi:hypothetical protein
MKIQLRIGAPDAITMAYATALQMVQFTGVEGKLLFLT